MSATKFARRLLAVHAHPDDEASKGAATTARYAAEGVEVLVVTCTGGEAGEILNEGLADIPPQDIPLLRREEMAASANALGISHHWLGYHDSGWYDVSSEQPRPGTFAAVPVESAATRLAQIIEDFAPQVMVTYDEKGGYPHPDHIHTHKVTAAAFRRVQSTMTDPPVKLYYVHEWTAAKMARFHQRLVGSDRESPYEAWLEAIRSGGDPGERVTTSVPCADFFACRDAALLAHRSQIPPRSHWFALPRDEEQLLWPTEEFELAISTVPPALTRSENDLFCGVELQGA